MPNLHLNECYVIIVDLNLELNQSFAISNNSLMKLTNMRSHQVRS